MFSPFHWNSPHYEQTIDWSDLKRNAQISEVSSKTVNEARARGIDVATIRNLSKAIHSHSVEPRRSHVYSRAGKNTKSS